MFDRIPHLLPATLLMFNAYGYTTLLAQHPDEARATVRPGPRSSVGGIWSTTELYIRLIQKTKQGHEKCNGSIPL